MRSKEARRVSYNVFKSLSQYQHRGIRVLFQVFVHPFRNCFHGVFAHIRKTFDIDARWRVVESTFDEVGGSYL